MLSAHALPELSLGGDGGDAGQGETAPGPGDEVQAHKIRARSLERPGTQDR